MIFTPTKLSGVFIIDPSRMEDERGFFARVYCRQEWAAHGLSFEAVQCSISWNIRKGTLRGMHYQAAPHEELKIVRCTQGSIFDAVVDLRAAAPTFRQWVGVELSADNRRMIFIPKGLAHGFLTLADNCEVVYQVSEFFHAESGRGVRWNDPAFGIQWPGEPACMSDRDRNYPDFQA